MFVNAGENTWNLAAHYYWFWIGFLESTEDARTWIHPLLTELYGHICTCQEDAYQTSLYLGAAPRLGRAFSSCSESTTTEEAAFWGWEDSVQYQRAKLKVEGDVGAYMLERWTHYMKQPAEDL